MAIQLTGRCSKASTRFREIGDTVAALNVSDGVLPSFARETPTAPPPTTRRLHAQPISSTAEWAAPRVFPAPCHGDALQSGVSADQFEEVDAVFYGRSVDWHLARLSSDI
jgi:hypothetical protein